jgi:hypothetical protein
MPFRSFEERAARVAAAVKKAGFVADVMTPAHDLRADGSLFPASCTLEVYTGS